MSYSIIKADLKKNKEDILGILKRNFPELSEPQKHYHWIYENNPNGPASCWMIKDENTGNVVGSTAIFPRRMRIRGKYITAGIAGDFAIDKTHRILGPALSLQKKVLSTYKDDRLHLLYGFPNKQSEPVLLKGGYKILGSSVRMVKPLNYKYLIERYTSLSFTTKIVSGITNYFSRIFSKEAQYKRPKGVSVEALSAFDNRFDDLWERVVDQWAIIGERSSSYLNWRFIHYPQHIYNIFALKQDGISGILGYIVFLKLGRMVYIDDIFMLNLYDAFDSLLAEFLLYCKKEAINSISIRFMGSKAFINRLEEYGFYIREAENKIIIHTCEDSFLMPHVLDTNNWYLLAVDNDV